jgi:hypothetical protein
MKTLQEVEMLPEITGAMIVIDSTTMKVHRHGGVGVGKKGAANERQRAQGN